MHLTRAALYFGSFHWTQLSASLMALFRKGGMTWALEGEHPYEQMKRRLVMFSYPNLVVSHLLVREGFSCMLLFSIFNYLAWQIPTQFINFKNHIYRQLCPHHLWDVPTCSVPPMFHIGCLAIGSNEFHHMWGPGDVGSDKPKPSLLWGQLAKDHECL